GERAEDEHDRVRAYNHARAKDPERNEWRQLARLDQHKGREKGSRTGEQADRLRIAPAPVRRLDDRVDEQPKRSGDGQRGGGVETPLRKRGPAFAQKEGREGEGDKADGDVDEEDPLPAEAVDDRTPDQPGRRRPDPAQRAPDPERLVALGALLEGGRDDRER